MFIIEPLRRKLYSLAIHTNVGCAEGPGHDDGIRYVAIDRQQPKIGLPGGERTIRSYTKHHDRPPSAAKPRRRNIGDFQDADEVPRI
jgi:hypothetical protein